MPTAGKSKTLELRSLFHTSLFLVSADAQQLSFVKYAPQCYFRLRCGVVWINLLIFRKNLKAIVGESSTLEEVNILVSSHDLNSMLERVYGVFAE